MGAVTADDCVISIELIEYYDPYPVIVESEATLNGQKTKRLRRKEMRKIQIQEESKHEDIPTPKSDRAPQDHSSSQEQFQNAAR